MAAYAAGGVAKANIWKTGVTAFRLSLVAFLVPFAFVSNEALLFKGPWHEILWVTVSAALGTLALAGALTGYWRSELNWFAGTLLGAAAVLLIAPEWQNDLTGLAIMVVVLGMQYVTTKSRETKNDPPHEGRNASHRLLDLWKDSVVDVADLARGPSLFVPGNRLHGVSGSLQLGEGVEQRTDRVVRGPAAGAHEVFLG